MGVGLSLLMKNGQREREKKQIWVILWQVFTVGNVRSKIIDWCYPTHVIRMLGYHYANVHQSVAKKC